MRPRPRQFQTAASHSFRVELSLDFAGPVSAEKARQAARRLLESLRVQAAGDEGLRGCRLVCHDLRQVITLIPTGQGASPCAPTSLSHDLPPGLPSSPTGKTDDRAD